MHERLPSVVSTTTTLSPLFRAVNALRGRSVIERYEVVWSAESPAPRCGEESLPATRPENHCSRVLRSNQASISDRSVLQTPLDDCVVVQARKRMANGSQIDLGGVGVGDELIHR